GAAQKLEIDIVFFWTAGPMAPYGRNRPQLGVDKMGDIGSIIGHGEVKIGSPGQKQNAGAYRIERGHQVALVHIIGTDVGIYPSTSLRVKVRGRSLRESRLPTFGEKILQRRCTRAAQMQSGTIPILAHRPGGVDAGK